MSDNIKENLSQVSAWQRVLFMLLFYIILYVLFVILVIVSMGQALFSLLSGERNENLTALGKSLNLYAYQILQFLTYNSEQKPFPFLQWPLPEDELMDNSMAAESGRDTESGTDLRSNK